MNLGSWQTKANRTTPTGSARRAASSGGAMNLLAGRFRLRSDGDELPIPAGNVVIGRASDCRLQLDGGMVSRRHARLSETVDGLVVEDLGSRNGVLVNQRKIGAPTLIVHGDVLGIGLYSFELIDDWQLSRSEHLSTLPPASNQFAVSDVEEHQQETVVARLDVLSPREREVLELIVLGHTQKEMAERLHVSVKTIETHRTHIAEKLECHSRAELVSYAISAGLLARLSGARPGG
jgi:DNA-binding CsgD family transcriptional regulator